MNFWKITDDGKLKTSEIITKLRKRLDVYVYDEEIDKEFPPPKKPTTRYFKPNIEADPELANLSANDLEEKGIEGITLREYLLLELDYFNRTGKHLDKQVITLCSGSRYSVGLVPGVGWNVVSRRLYIGWYGADYRSGALRARAVVKLDTVNSEPCSHQLLHTERLRESETSSRFVIVTYCADCGKEIKTVEIK